jgi:hypothetical protein
VIAEAEKQRVLALEMRFLACWGREESHCLRGRIVIFEAHSYCPRLPAVVGPAAGVDIGEVASDRTHGLLVFWMELHRRPRS